MPSTANEVQSLERGLAALAIINADGWAKIADIAARLDLPRATAYRIVTTLAKAGYCLKIPNSAYFMITPKAAALSNGLGDAERLTLAAIAVLDRLRQQIAWPMALTTPDRAHMRVRLATDKASPVALERFRAGLPAPMLMTTTGLLYLALTDEPRRAMALAAYPENQRSLYFSRPGEMEAQFAFARRHRYLLIPTSGREASMGVPVMLEDRPIGGLVMRYSKSALPADQAVARYLPLLRRAVEEMVEAMAVQAISSGSAGSELHTSGK
jgi:DNA-binding IclR family transcriptional regulator